jgi:hypothetical protein
VKKRKKGRLSALPGLPLDVLYEVRATVAPMTHGMLADVRLDILVHWAC